MPVESILNSVCTLRLAYLCAFLTRIVTTHMLVLFINNYIETNNRRLSQWPKCMLPVLTRRVHWPVRIRDCRKNDKVRRFEKNPTVPCIYWPINGSAAMHVVLTKKKKKKKKF